MPKYPFPDDMFTPPDERTEDWPDDLELRRAVDWFKSKMTADEWEARRLAAAERLYDAALHNITDTKGRFFEARDTFGWYLFLAEANLDHVWNYEPVFGSRVIPVFKAIGRDFDALKTVAGVEDRIAEIVGKNRSQPNGGLFELLVASAYLREGAEVAFVPEQPGVAKTHDLDATIDGVTWAVECKRMEVGDTGDHERNRIRELWNPIAHHLARAGRSILAEVEFHVPPKDLPDDHLVRRVASVVLGGSKSVSWDDASSTGVIKPLDMGPVKAVLADNDLMQGSSRLMELLTGRYVRNMPYNTVLKAKFGGNPRYITDLDLAVVLRYEVTAEAAIDAKARDIFRKLREANQQLPSDRPSVVHIGFEAVEGDRIEKARYEKILATTERFDPEGKPLEWVYCHYFVPESPPDESWAFDETTQWAAIRPQHPKPLDKPFLIMPDSADGRTGPHWQV